MIILCSTDDKVIQRWRDSLESLHALSVCADRNQLNDLVSQHSGAIILNHMNFPGMDSAASITELIQSTPSVRVIACADVPNDDQGLELLKVGVFGYCNTWIAAEQLRLVIEQVTLGEVWVGRSLILKLIRDIPKENASPDYTTHCNLDGFGLTEREYEAAKLVGEGCSNKQIANTLAITERTVKAHLSSVFLKTGCKDRIQLALLISQPPSQPTLSKLGS